MTSSTCLQSHNEVTNRNTNEINKIGNDINETTYFLNPCYFS